MSGAASIRPAVQADAERLGVVHTAVWREAYAGHMPAAYLAALDERRAVERWRHQLAAGPALGRSVLVADVDGEVVGFATTGPSRDDPPQPPLELYAIYLLAAHRGTGLAQRLLDVALARADGGAVSLWVIEGNARARGFYSRNGFSADGLTQIHTATGTPELRLLRPAQGGRLDVPRGAAQAEAGE